MTISSSKVTVFVATDTDTVADQHSNCSDDSSNSQLPRPVSSEPDVADSGRIRFGAAFRLPIRK